MYKNGKKNFLRALKKKHGIIAQARDIIGISNQTYYNWRKDDPEFALACDDIIEGVVGFVEDKLFEKIEAGSESSIQFYLRHKGNGYTAKTDITTKGNALSINYIIPKENDE